MFCVEGNVSTVAVCHGVFNNTSRGIGVFNTAFKPHDVWSVKDQPVRHGQHRRGFLWFLRIDDVNQVDLAPLKDGLTVVG